MDDHRACLFRGLRPKWLCTEEVLGRFGGAEDEALRRMSSFVCEADLRRSGRFQENPGRKMAIYLLRRLGGLSQTEIAKWMQARGGAAIAKASERYGRELERNRKLRKLNEEVASQIMSYVKP